MSALRGRNIVITGATRGIGAATARALAGEGARLLLVARGPEVAELAVALGGASCRADVADELGVEAVRAAAGVQWGDDTDAVVHAAGAFGLAPLAAAPVAAFDAMLAVNLRAAFLLMRAFLPAMLARRSGHLVGIGSIAGRSAFPHNGAYSASKFGLRGLHAVLDAELRGTGVRSTLIEPAATDTPLWDAIDTAANPGLPSRAQMLRPEQVAEAVVFALTRPPETAVRNIIMDRN